MLKAWTCLLTFFLAQAQPAPMAAPFWRAKPQAYERVKNGEILVSVSDVGGDPNVAHDLKVNGGGQVQTPCDFAFERAQKYEEIAKLTDYVEHFSVEPGGRVMDIGLKAYGYKSEFKLAVQPEAKQTPRHLDFHMLTGPMKDFTWRLDFTSVPPAKCEIGIQGDYAYHRFPIPKIFLEFGLEVLFQRMAARLRSHLESAYGARADSR